MEEILLITTLSFKIKILELRSDEMGLVNSFQELKQILTPKYLIIQHLRKKLKKLLHSNKTHSLMIKCYKFVLRLDLPLLQPGHQILGIL